MVQVKAALRRLPSAHERLLVVRATCEFQLERISKAKPEGRQAGVTTATRAEPTGPLAAAERGGPAGHWLRHSHGNVVALLGALDLIAPASPMKAHRAGAVGADRGWDATRASAGARRPAAGRMG